jgi:hypothetical protein
MMMLDRVGSEELEPVSVDAARRVNPCTSAMTGIFRTSAKKLVVASRSSVATRPR